MKKSILSIAILTSGLFVSSLLVTSCAGKKEQTKEEDAQHMEGDTTSQHEEMAMVYSCPMHPEVTGKEGDKCSKCGMKLERATSNDSTKTEAEHQH